LRNIIEDERVSLLFMISGSNNVIRVNGKAKITTDEELMSLFVKKERYPKSIIVIEAVDVYFQCARALMRSKLWEDKVEDLDLPTPGSILKEITNGSFDAEAYDSSWPERYKKSLW
ncbi:MAG: putative pyridoxine 5'-phosphate oxidase superfamily flavin-nucleotide-binding protein, partial [Cocleimonas sp.]